MSCICHLGMVPVAIEGSIMYLNNTVRVVNILILNIILYSKFPYIMLYQVGNDKSPITDS